jgi:hypothetical protein
MEESSDDPDLVNTVLDYLRRSRDARNGVITPSDEVITPEVKPVSEARTIKKYQFKLKDKSGKPSEPPVDTSDKRDDDSEIDDDDEDDD